MPPPPVQQGDGRRDRDYERFLEEARALREKLESAISAADEGSIWLVYARAEKLVAVLKFRLGYETPGVFAKLPQAVEPGALLDAALSSLSQSIDDISGQRMREAVESLRSARNALRAYLIEKRKSALRAERGARRSRTPKAA